MKPELTAAVLALALSGCVATKMTVEPVAAKINPAKQQLLREYQQRPIGYPMYEHNFSFLGIDLGTVGWYGWHGDKEALFTLKAESNLDVEKTVSYLTSHLADLQETYNVNSEDVSFLEKFLAQSSEDVYQIRIDARYKKGQEEGAILVYENDSLSLKDSALIPTPLVLSIFHYSIPKMTGKSYFFGRILDHWIIKSKDKLEFFKESNLDKK